MKLFITLIFSAAFILSFYSCVRQKNCGEDFKVFIEKFKKDSIFQKQHIEFPLDEYYSDEDFPLDIMERSIDEEHFTFIDFENELPIELRNKNLYDIHINQGNDTIFYQMFGKNNSIDVTYTFKCDQKTYKLVKIEDLTD